MQLETLLGFDDIVIQCHDDPDADAIASGFALKRYLDSKGKTTRLVYSGPRVISKGNLVRMVELFHIDIAHVEPSERSENPPELLITVDCQDGESNVTSLPRKELATIDHHLARSGKQAGRDILREVRSDHGACATVLWSMLKDAGFELDKDLSSALYYGLYMDTVEFKSLAHTHKNDQEMREELEHGALDRAGLEKLKRANLSAQTLRILGTAISELHIYQDYHFAVAQAQPCDPNILGIISDQIMEVDGVDLCVSFCMLPETERSPGKEVKFSVRCYLNGLTAKELAEYIALSLGGQGGGGTASAGGTLSEQKLRQKISNMAEISWDGFSSAVGRLIYREIASYCEHSPKLREAYPEIAQKLDDRAYIQQLYDQAEQGVAIAQSILGFHYLYGYGDYVKQDSEQATKWLRKAAEQGLPDAQLGLGYCLIHGKGVERDPKEGVKLLQKAAEQGLDEAQYMLGTAYSKGVLVAQDLTYAAFWFYKAAEQGHPDAQTHLGYCFYHGEGVKRNWKEATAWYHKAAEQGWPEAQYLLGTCYYNGDGVEQDLSQAAVWFRKAAEQGFPAAQYVLGVCYYSGEGVEQDLSQAAFWFYKAAEQGHPDAQRRLGYCFYHGEGVKPDMDQAILWFHKAADQGNTDAKQMLIQLGVEE